MPYTLHPTPYTPTLHPTPYTLHPTPYTLHPTPPPYNLDPNRRSTALPQERLGLFTIILVIFMWDGIRRRGAVEDRVMWEDVLAGACGCGWGVGCGCGWVWVWVWVWVVYNDFVESNPGHLNPEACTPNHQP